jgi:outer membrane protein assembly factor BamD (BamD/ComL family)
METPAIKKKVSQAQKDASKRYYEKNKARISAHAADRGMERYCNDNEYREERIAYMKSYYRSKKEQLEQAKQLLAKNNIAWMPVADKTAYGVSH